MPSTRKQVRERLVTLYDAESVFSQVYGYAPMDLQGMHPVLCIYNDNTNYDFITADLRNFFYTYVLDVYAKRINNVNTEDQLDTLQETIRDVIKDNIGDATWDHIELGSSSDAYFAEISGVAYRIERFTLQVKVQGE